ncbi:tetratricopeptide repeat protein [Actinomadura litoris]|uniref:tetratricopeptide repeat protein n=1 Tax=Actinomadura litoris TaxID=2678616 RepID=UPI001FA6DD6A|nr:tetratricopeptide repeat protein [Actinomadura litoris]
MGIVASRRGGRATGSSRRLRLAGLGLLVLVVAVTATVVVGIVGKGPSFVGSGTVSAPVGHGRADAIGRYQQRLREVPGDHQTWAVLGGAYVEQARIGADPAYYPKAEGALRRSLALRRTDNDAAMVGMGALANARHDFRAGARWGEEAKKINPSSPGVFGVLADAYTQLGDYPAATAAVGRMTRLAPGVSSFTRASYELEMHGNRAGARILLLQALRAAYVPSDIAYCRYYLGELHFHAGDFSQAAHQYRLAYNADKSYTPALEGIAKAAARRGDHDQAVKAYQEVVGRMPQPQYIMEYLELLNALGRKDQAAQQRRLLDSTQRLLAAGGVTDNLSAAEYAADTGDARRALEQARAEWRRRHSVIVADALAWALHLNGKDRQALGLAEKATRLGWQNAQFYQHKAAIEAALGDHDAARRDLVRATRANPHLDQKIPALGRVT